MFGFAVVAQFFLFPFILWGCVHFISKEDNEMQFLSAFFGTTFAIVVALVVGIGMRTRLEGMELVLATTGCFFAIIFAFVMFFAKIRIWRAVTATLLFCAIRFTCEFAVYTAIVAPVAEAATKR